MGFCGCWEGFLQDAKTRFPQTPADPEQEHVTRAELPSRAKTSRASLDRMLDLSNPSLTVVSLGKAAAALGRKVELRFLVRFLPA
jgi:hypothetical protein